LVYLSASFPNSYIFKGIPFSTILCKCSNQRNIFNPFLYLFIYNILHYKVIVHVPVFLVLYYVLLYNKIVLKTFHSGHVQGLSSSVFESL
jgi:hypothetical protein